MSQQDQTLSFEQALSELEKIVRQLEDEKFSLEDAIQAYERGIALRAHCETILESARMKIEKINAKTEGGVTVESLSLQKVTEEGHEKTSASL